MRGKKEFSNWEKATLIWNAPNVTWENCVASLNVLEERTRDIVLKEQLKERIEYEKKYFEAYTQAQIDAVKLAFEIASKGDMLSFVSSSSDAVMGAMSNVLENANFLELFGVSGSEESAKSSLEGLITGVHKMYESHINYFAAYNQLIETELNLATAQTRDYNDQIEILKG